VKRTKYWIDHVVRYEGLLKLVIEGRIEGRARVPKGKPRTRMIDDTKEGSYVGMKRRAEDRHKWRVWIPRVCLRAENF
jgi:hypothetical protein